MTCYRKNDYTTRITRQSVNMDYTGYKYYSLLPDKDVKLLTNGKNLRFTLSWNYLDILDKKQQELAELKELSAITKQDSQNIETMIGDIDLIRTILTNLPNNTSI